MDQGGREQCPGMEMTRGPEHLLCAGILLDPPVSVIPVAPIAPPPWEGKKWLALGYATGISAQVFLTPEFLLSQLDKKGP